MYFFCSIDIQSEDKKKLQSQQRPSSPNLTHPLPAILNLVKKNVETGVYIFIFVISRMGKLTNIVLTVLS